MDIPEGWGVVRSGITQEGDRCAIINSLQQCEQVHGPAIIQGKWDAIMPEKIGLPVNYFRAVIRNGGMKLKDGRVKC
jgi:hypothetical protein